MFGPTFIPSSSIGEISSLPWIATLKIGEAFKKAGFVSDIVLMEGEGPGSPKFLVKTYIHVVIAYSAILSISVLLNFDF